MVLERGAEPQERATGAFLRVGYTTPLVELPTDFYGSGK